MPAKSLQTTDAAQHTLVVAGNAGVFNDISDLAVTNESATAAVVSLSDGTVTYKIALAANGGAVANFRQALPATSKATPWTVQSSAVVTLDFIVVWKLRQ